MVQKHLMIAIDWYGPFKSLTEARAAAKLNWQHGLYLCTGMTAYQRKVQLQYIGIGKDIQTRLTDEHHKLKLVTRSRQIWLGEAVTAEPSGRTHKVTRATLDYAEWVHARFMRLPLNDKKTKQVPPRSVTVLNRWWKANFTTIRRNRPHGDWPDLIDYPSYDLPARLVWFGGKQRLLLAPDYAAP